MRPRAAAKLIGAWAGSRVALRGRTSRIGSGPLRQGDRIDEERLPLARTRARTKNVDPDRLAVGGSPMGHPDLPVFSGGRDHRSGGEDPGVRGPLSKRDANALPVVRLRRLDPGSGGVELPLARRAYGLRVVVDRILPRRLRQGHPSDVSPVGSIRPLLPCYLRLEDVPAGRVLLER